MQSAHEDYRAVRGVRFDPLHPARFLSFAEDSSVRVWDVRRLGGTARPVCTIAARQGSGGGSRLCAARWSPCRRGLVATAERSGDNVSLWNVDGGGESGEADEVDGAMAEVVAGVLGAAAPLPLPAPPAGHTAPSQPWFEGWLRRGSGCMGLMWPMDGGGWSRLAVAVPDDGARGGVRLEDVVVAPSIGVALAPGPIAGVGRRGTALVTAGRTGAFVSSAKSADPVHVVRARLKLGMSLDVRRSLEVLAATPRSERSDTLQTVWKLLGGATTSPSSDDGGLVAPSLAAIAGAAQLVRAQTREHLERPRPWGMIQGRDSVARSLIVQLCGWPKPEEAHDWIAAERNPTRAAALALWHGASAHAASILREAASARAQAADTAIAEHDPNGPRLRREAELFLTASVAVAGAPSTPGTAATGSEVWRNTCTEAAERASQRHPYLAALLDTLATAQDEASIAAREWHAHSLAPVFRRKGVSLLDKVACAARFLPRNALGTFLDHVVHSAREQGDLAALVVTGLSTDAVRILQADLDRRGDVQIAAFVSTLLPPRGLSRSAARRVFLWIATYRTLLDRWGLFADRAHFDTQRALLVPVLDSLPAPPEAARRALAAALSSSPEHASRSNPSSSPPPPPPPSASGGGGGGGNNTSSGPTHPSASPSPKPSPINPSASTGNMSVRSGGSSTPVVSRLQTHTARPKGSWMARARKARTEPTPAAAKAPTDPLLVSLLAEWADPATSHPSPWAKSSSSALPTLATDTEVTARCGFCNDPLVLTTMLRWATSRSEELSHKPARLRTCLRCRKQLPRCALCLLPLTVANPLLRLRAASKPKRPLHPRLSHPTARRAQDPLCAHPVPASAPSQSDAQPFASWWSWCQGCRHGGHAAHMAEWFASHDVCPVARCRCRCRSLDPRLGTTPRVLQDPRIASPGRSIQEADPIICEQ